ncbi:MAG: hypothetical protein Aurels2KO_42020 [Aureliella sp.]
MPRRRSIGEAFHKALRRGATLAAACCLPSAFFIPTALSQEPDSKPAATATASASAKTDATKKRLDAVESKLDAILNKLEQVGAPAEKPAQAKLGKPETTEDAPKESSNKEAKTATETKSGDQAPDKAPKKAPKILSLKLDEESLKSVPWRSLGPANMSGRISDLAVHPQDPSLWYFATASGGLLRTENQGTTVTHQFDHESTVSIGAIALDPNDKETIWVGTGEANPRNSVSYGNGVYKSTDGGKTWDHLGLKESYQIGRILIDPSDSDTVYVGALGRLYGSNRERGVYRTTNGGKDWEQVLYVDDNTGVIDMIMHPEEPGTIIAALWDRERDGFDGWPGSEPKPDGIDGYDPIRKWGPGAGLYKTTDGGDSWTKLTNGLPPGKIGRIGLDWQTGGDHAIFAIIDCEDIGKGPKPFKAFLGLAGKDTDDGPVITQVYTDSPADKAGIEVGDALASVDGNEIKKFDELLDVLREKKLGDKIEIATQRGDEASTSKIKLLARPGSREQVPTVWLGVTGDDKDGKIVLQSVTDKAPAAKAGLKAGDVIEQVDGKSPKDYSALIADIQSRSDGEKVTLSIARGEESMDLEVVLKNRPTRSTRPAQSAAYMGIFGEDASSGGALMTRVTDGGPSEKGGLKTGDIITKVGKKKIDDYQALIAEIRARKPEDKMKLAVKRGEKTVEVVVTLGDRNALSGGGDRPYTYSYFGQTPNAQDMQGADGYKYGGIYKSTDAGETWQRVNSLNTRPMYFSVIRVDPNDASRLYVLGVSQFQSADGGMTFTSNFGGGVHADAHDLWISPDDGRHMIIGGDGGYYVTRDRGKNWDHINTAAIGQFYHVAIRPTEPYWVVGGLQDNGSWAGPAISRQGGAIIQDWISVGGGDGFVCRVDPNDPDLVYYESQNGGMARRNLRTGERASIRPRRERGVEYRFNWKTPFILSNHNSKVFYCAGNYVFRSLDRGNDLQKISPELTLTKRGSATALAESAIDQNVMYVGTDDGALWATKDGGANWTNITDNLHAPGPRWVSTIEASRHEAGRVYVCLDGHRSDDDAPYVFVSQDYGETFKPLHSNLPTGSSRCMREDLYNENLLYLGTEFAFFVSVDQGKNWMQMNQTLPSVAIHDVAIHPTNGEIVLATHGRSLWAADVTGLRSVDAETFKKKSALYAPTDVMRWRRLPSRGRTNRRFVGQNPTSGATFWYSIAAKAKSVKLRVEDIEGKKVAELNGQVEAGLHRLVWNLQRAAAQGRRASLVSNGSYRVTLVVDGKDIQSRVVDIVRDPDVPDRAVSEEVYEAKLIEDQERADRKAAAKAAGVDVRVDY